MTLIAPAGALQAFLDTSLDEVLAGADDPHAALVFGCSADVFV